MASVVDALKPHHDVGADRQPIDDLALSFVAPLGADNDNIGHRRLLFRFALKRAKPRRIGKKPSRGSLRPSPKRSAGLSKVAPPPHFAARREPGSSEKPGPWTWIDQMRRYMPGAAIRPQGERHDPRRTPNAWWPFPARQLCGRDPARPRSRILHH